VQRLERNRDGRVIGRGCGGHGDREGHREKVQPGESVLNRVESKLNAFKFNITCSFCVVQ